MAVLAGVFIGFGSHGLAILLAGALTIPVLLWPVGGALFLLATRPIVDCFWNLRFLDLAGVQVNFQSVLGVLAPLCLWIVVFGGRDLARPRRLDAAFLAFVTVTLFGVAISPAPMAGAADFGRIALPIVYFWIGKRLGVEGRRVYAATWVLAWYGALSLVGALLQLTGVILPAEGAVGSPLDVIRVTGFYHHPLDIAMRACIALPFAAALGGAFRNVSARAGMYAWAAVMAVTAWITLVRSALLATLLEGVSFVFLVGRRRLAVWILASGIIAAIALPPVRLVIQSALRPLKEGSFYELGTGRGLLFAAQISAFQDASIGQKLLGRGLHSTPGVNVKYAPTGALGNEYFDLEEGNIGAHNQYLRVLTESGVVGLGLFVTVLWLSMRCCLQAAKSKLRLIDRRFALASVALMLAVMVYGLAGTPADLPSVAWPLWSVVGVSSGILERQARSRELR